MGRARAVKAKGTEVQGTEVSPDSSKGTLSPRM